jgi:Peptidase family M28
MQSCIRSPDMPPQIAAPSSERLQAHWSQLCTRIGERRAGSPGDQAAAEYILEQFRQAGLREVHGESFPCVSVAEASVEISIGKGSSLKRVPARVLSGSPSTPGSKAVAGGLVWVEMPEQADRLFQPSLHGKIVVLIGPMPTRADLHQRLVKCQPAAVIHVDDRLPFTWVKDDGVYPVWVKQYGMPPTATIPYQAAWELRKSGADRARARLAVKLVDASSQNLVGDIPGRRPELPMVLLGAHHDTQCNNSGADDNASGVVALLEMARLLSGTWPRRTIRLVSFGAEEHLSVGSACYVRAHRKEMSTIGAVFNLDSVSSPLGHHWALRAGTKAFGAWLLKELNRQDFEVMEKTAAMPFADHFPFSIFGVPAVSFLRPNMDSGMRWQHHSAQDNLDNVSVAELGRVVTAVSRLTYALANQPRWPFTRGLAPEQTAETARLGRELYGLAAGQIRRKVR